MKEFVKQIIEYESDTFSGSGSEITEKEACLVIKSILTDYFEHHLDGLSIDSRLEEIRDKLKS